MHIFGIVALIRPGNGQNVRVANKDKVKKYSKNLAAVAWTRLLTHSVPRREVKLADSHEL